MRSLSILALTLALGSALSVEKGPKRKWQPCGGFNGCDLGETSVQELMNSTDADAEGDVSEITCRDLHRVWREFCGSKVPQWELTTQCMIADDDNSGTLTADEVEDILDVRAEWPEEADEKCKCGRAFTRLSEEGVLSGEGLEKFMAKKCWANNDFDYSDATAGCRTETTDEFTWAEAECLCAGLETEVVELD